MPQRTHQSYPLKSAKVTKSLDVLISVWFAKLFLIGIYAYVVMYQEVK